VTQKTIIMPRIAATLWAGAVSGSGAIINAMQTIGPAKSPMVRRR
jgi:hypothetical protein